ncbi:hypothetical protein HN832_02955 [archaeon]|jgi:hypothetical protein|nr:hypothetical protein [archaeon]MBT4373315.1 hypothetical protein [archaeon]MBT4531660.1 hypothetical protein [archaeon]MBT7001162.1 hypothetical protein [archaeon]MBT7282352.1 hypothetical protein [archaeon]
MEMTIGTMVTIVLLVAVLVMILFFITRITETGTTAIEGIDAAVRNEINNLFSKDSSKKIELIPRTRQITLKKGENNLGFGIMIRNTGEAGSFHYGVTAKETNCGMRLPEADNLIFGREDDVVIPAGSVTEADIMVRFDIPETTPPCRIRYAVDIEKAGQPYASSISMDVLIEGE